MTLFGPEGREVVGVAHQVKILHRIKYLVGGILSKKKFTFEDVKVPRKDNI